MTQSSLFNLPEQPVTPAATTRLDAVLAQLRADLRTPEVPAEVNPAPPAPATVRMHPTEAMLDRQGLRAAYRVYQLSLISPDPLPTEESTIVDILRRYERFGSVSDKQVNYLRVLMDRIANRGARQSARDAERAQAADVPRGRMRFTGEVISTREQDSRFGTVHKVLLQHPDGWRVWGTIPAAVGAYRRQLERGDRLTVTATVEPSDRDPKFGFYSRPTQPEVTYRQDAA